MNYITILLSPTSNKRQMRRYQIYEKHFSTDPYNFLFVYVFKFLSVLAFCRWMSFMFSIKDIIASKETIKSKLPNFQIIFWRSPCSWLLHQDWNNCDEMLFVLFCSYGCLDHYQERYLYCTRPYFTAPHTRKINEQKPFLAKQF